MPAKLVTVRGKRGGDTDVDQGLEDLLGELHEGDDGGGQADAGQAPADAQRAPPGAPQGAPQPPVDDEPPDPGERDTTVMAQYFNNDGEWDESNKNVGDFLEDPSGLKALAEEVLERFQKEPLLLEEAVARIGDEADKEKIMVRLKACAAMKDEGKDEDVDGAKTKPVGGVPGPGVEGGKE